MNDYAGFFITWTTYGTWLPGDARGWRKLGAGNQLPRPRLEAWCANNLNSEPVFLRPVDRETVDAAIREHCKIRGWVITAVNARTKHVHVVVQAYAKPEKVRDQLKANCTRRLRIQTDPLICEPTWTRGGDCEVLEDEGALGAATRYVLEAQD